MSWHIKEKARKNSSSEPPTGPRGRIVTDIQLIMLIAEDNACSKLEQSMGISEVSRFRSWLPNSLELRALMQAMATVMDAKLVGCFPSVVDALKKLGPDWKDRCS
jgi:hypothetical protein